MYHLQGVAVLSNLQKSSKGEGLLDDSRIELLESSPPALNSLFVLGEGRRPSSGVSALPKRAGHATLCLQDLAWKDEACDRMHCIARARPPLHACAHLACVAFG